MDAIAAGVVFEDERLLALNKPAGVASPAAAESASAPSRPCAPCAPARRLNWSTRLDRDTSGLLLFAKKRSAPRTQALLREGGGEARSGVGKATSPHRPHARRHHVRRCPLHVGLRQGGERHVQVRPDGKPSLSHFRALERRGGHSYCEVAIVTGRTHQIRVHARHIGHPVAGDDKYGDPDTNRRLRDRAGLRRLFLHAASLEFSLDDGRSPYLLHAPLAPELSEVLDRLAG